MDYAMQSVRYEGALPWRQLYTIVATREFVLYSLRNIKPVKVDMHKLGQSTIKLLRTTEKTCCSIQKTL